MAIWGGIGMLLGWKGGVVGKAVGGVAGGTIGAGMA